MIRFIVIGDQQSKKRDSIGTLRFTGSAIATTSNRSRPGAQNHLRSLRSRALRSTVARTGRSYPAFVPGSAFVALG